MSRNIQEAVHSGATIKALREAYGWRLGKFAAVLEISHSYLSNIENGRKSATPELLRRIADILGVPLAALTSEFDASDVA